MTTLGELTVVQALAGGIFGWILVELWQRALDTWNYDLIGFDRGWVTTTFIAILATGIFLVYLFYIESPDKPGPGVDPPELVGIGPTKTLANETSDVPFGPNIDNLRAVHREPLVQRRRIPRTLRTRLVRTAPIVVPELPLTGLLEQHDDDILADMAANEEIGDGDFRTE